MTAPNVIVIGGGPAGVAASWPMVTRGLKVLMLEAGTGPLAQSQGRPPLFQLRQGGKDTWRHLLNADLSGLRDVGDVSPKLRALMEDRVGGAYRAVNGIVREGIDTVGCLAFGGLSNVWGAVSLAFDDNDLKDWPITAADLAPAYDQVARRIGISGDGAGQEVHGPALPVQPPLPLTPTAEQIFEAYRNQSGGAGFHLARSQNAVLSLDHEGRQACDLNGGCIWGCSIGAIYNAADEIPLLNSHGGFQLLPGRAVRRISCVSGGHAVETIEFESGKIETFEAEVVVLAAGTIPSTRLALGCLKKYDEELPLLTTPGVGAAYICPSRLGAPLPGHCFGLAQLAYRVDIDEGREYVYGLFYDAATLSAPDLLSHMPLSRAGGRALLRRTQSAMMVTLLYFPGSLSRNTVKLQRHVSGDRLIVSGRYVPDIRSRIRAGMRRVNAEFRRLGLYCLPGSKKQYRPGAESHFAGTLAMGHMTSAEGELIGVNNLFVADGSVFSGLPAKHPTLTIMANAHRIGENIARRILT